MLAIGVLLMMVKGPPQVCLLGQALQHDWWKGRQVLFAKHHLWLFLSHAYDEGPFDGHEIAPTDTC